MNIAQLLDEAERLCIRFEARPDGRLMATPAAAITADLAEAIQRYKPTLRSLHHNGRDDRGIQLLRMFLAGELEHEDLGDDEPLPEPCPQCRSLDRWWDALDGDHCQRCNPPTASRRLKQHARRIRANGKRRCGIW